MRTASSRIVILWITVLCLLATLDGLASAQAPAGSKRKLSGQSLDQGKAATPGTTTTDTWKGGASGNWSVAGNWNNGAITSGENILINATTAATVDDFNVSIGNLTLSNAGDSVTTTGATLTVNGTITNNGTINLAATVGGSQGVLYVGGDSTLTGTGALVLGDGQTQNFITGTSGAILTNSSTIEGGWKTSGGYTGVGQGEIALANSGTINANLAGGTLNLDPTGSVGSTNTGKLEATNGATLQMQGGTWTQTGAGTISAATGSTVALQDGVSITGGTLTTSGTGLFVLNNGGTVSLSNLTLAGTFDMQVPGTTNISGTITNNGSINMLANVAGEGQIMTTANATLAGTGVLVLGNETTQNVIGGSGGTTLTNASTIEGGTAMSSGYDSIGNGQIALANNGTINANLSGGVLVVNPIGSGASTNTKTMEATNGGILILSGGTWTQSGAGTITAAAGSAVDMQNGVSITGGTLSTSGSGVIQQNDAGTVSLSNITLNGTYNITAAGGATDISGTITNNGTINLLQTNGDGVVGQLYLTGNTRLSGTGTVVLGNETSQNFITGVSGTTLTNDSTIAGGATARGNAQIGIGQIILVNNGTINANVSGAALFVDPLSSSTTPSTNTATMEATNGGILVVNGGYWTQTGAGTISAAAGSTVQLQSGVSITGGTLTSSGSGLFSLNDGSTISLSNLTNAATLDLQDPGTLNISGTITNNGSINMLANVAGEGQIMLTANTTLTGKGVLLLGNETTQNVIGGSGGTILTNASTIEGGTNMGGGSYDSIGNGQISLANTGTIDANVNAGLLYVNPLGSATNNTNTGTMEATGGGILILNGSSWTQSGAGKITAATGSTVELTNGLSITGGTLTTSGTGVIEETNGQTVSLNTLTNSGTYNLLDSATTRISGTITNNGTINLESTGSPTTLYLTGNTTLTGNGVVDLKSGGNNIIDGVSGAVLTNASTIEGTGSLGNGHITITNAGTFDSNVSGGTLAILPGSGGFTNYNGTTHTLTGGSYIANGGNITFAAGNTVGTTTLSASVTEEAGGQLINTTNGANALAGLTSITSTGGLTTDVNLTDAGAFSNAGSLTILKGTTFNVKSLTQISGGSLTAGTYVLDANLNITGVTQSFTTNAANVTLAGGIFHNANGTNAMAALAANTGKLTLAGDATFTTTAAGFNNTGTLTINGGSSFTAKALAQITGTGSIQTLSGGTFVLDGNLDVSTGTANITTNSATLTLEGTGTIENTSNSSNALLNLAGNTKSLTLASAANFTTTGNFSNSGTLTVNSGSTFTVLSGKSLTNYTAASNTLTGGTYVVGGTLAFNAGTTGAIKTDAANLTLDGTGELKNTTTGAASTNALVDLATISSAGSFTLASNADFTAAAGFTNGGKLTINSGSAFTLTGTNTLTNLASGTLTGGTYTVGGTLQLTATNGGITTNAANLTLTGTTAKILDGTTNALAGFDNNTSTGTFTLAGNAVLTTAAANLTDAGTLDVAKGSTLTVGGTGHNYNQTAGKTTIDGTLGGIAGATVTGGMILGAGTVKGNLSVGNASGTAATINVGDSGVAGLLSITGKYTQLATGAMTGTINGTAAGTGFSQLKVTGAAALAGTINFTVTTAFQASLTLGEKFTVLSASAVTGTFSNSTIAINSTFHFTVSYTATGVVLTVASGPAAAPSEHRIAQMTTASAKPAVSTAGKSKSPVVISGLRRVSAAEKILRPIAVVEWEHSNARLAREFELNSLRSWERIPAVHAWPVAAPPAPRAANEMLMHSQPEPGLWRTREIRPVETPLGTTRTGVSNLRREPVRILSPMLPRTGR